MSTSVVHLLIVEDREADALLVVRQLRRGDIELTYERVQTAAGLVAALAARAPDVVISDYNMPSFNAADALRILHDHQLDVPFILVSGQIGEETAVAMMRAGAHDFVLKDSMARLVPAVQRELREAAKRRQHRAASAALRDSEDRLRLLAEHVPDIIFRYRLMPDAQLDYISPAVTTLTGYEPPQLYADPTLIAAMVDPADREAFEASWRSPDPPPTLAVGWCRPDGSQAWMQQRAVGVCDGDGALVAVEGILRDVTDQVLADRQRELLDRELRQAERLDSLGRLAGGIAHDFNNLLTVITTYTADVFETLPSEHPSRPDLAKIGQAADQAAALTRQLLVFSRLEPSQHETLDLNTVVTDIERMLRRTIGEDIEFLTTLHPGLPAVTVDRTKIEQVIVNLIMNARAAMPNGGRLRLSTQNAELSTMDVGVGQPAQGVQLAVDDTGTGMTPEVVQRAFEPFFTTKGPGEGTGLGLATAYGAVTEAGGVIRLSSLPGHGTTVTVVLPAADRQLTTPAASLSPFFPGAGQTVVVVEDEQAVREVVTRILTRSGYEVLPAATPKDALALCTNPAVNIDALLTDVIMPEMSGPQLAIRVREIRPDLKVLLMSGYTAGSPLHGHAPFTDLPLIRKPFTAATLLHNVHDLLTE